VGKFVVVQKKRLQRIEKQLDEVHQKLDHMLGKYAVWTDPVYRKREEAKAEAEAEAKARFNQKVPVDGLANEPSVIYTDPTEQFLDEVQEKLGLKHDRNLEDVEVSYSTETPIS